MISAGRTALMPPSMLSRPVPATYPRLNSLVTRIIHLPQQQKVATFQRPFPSLWRDWPKQLMSSTITPGGKKIDGVGQEAKILPTKRFQVVNESFVCEHCGDEVLPTTCGIPRNHCPSCLHSMHVDVNPGDRANSCGGLMEPIGGVIHGKKGYVIVHQCLTCGQQARSKFIPEQDVQPDNLDLFIELSTRPLTHSKKDKKPVDIDITPWLVLGENNINKIRFKYTKPAIEDKTSVPTNKWNKLMEELGILPGFAVYEKSAEEREPRFIQIKGEKLYYTMKGDEIKFVDDVDSLPDSGELPLDEPAQIWLNAAKFWGALYKGAKLRSDIPLIEVVEKHPQWPVVQELIAAVPKPTVEGILSFFEGLRSKALVAADGSKFPYPFGEVVKRKIELSPEERINKLRHTIDPDEEHLPLKMGERLDHGGLQQVYPGKVGEVIKFGKTSRTAERLIVVQKILEAYDVPHLPLKTDPKALELARHGVVIQERFPEWVESLSDIAFKHKCNTWKEAMAFIKGEYGDQAVGELYRVLSTVSAINGDHKLKQGGYVRGYNLFWLRDKKDYEHSMIIDMIGKEKDDWKHVTNLVYYNEGWFLFDW